MAGSGLSRVLKMFWRDDDEERDVFSADDSGNIRRRIRGELVTVKRLGIERCAGAVRRARAGNKQVANAPRVRIRRLPGIGRVRLLQRIGGAEEVIALHQHARASVETDAIEADVGVVVIEDMTFAVTDAGVALDVVGEPIVVVGHAIPTDVLEMLCAGIRESHLVVIVELRPRNRRVIRADGDVEQTIRARRQITMIDPDVMARAKRDGIRVGILDGEIAKDDVRLRVDIEPEAIEDDPGVRADNGLVAFDADCGRIGPGTVRCAVDDDGVRRGGTGVSDETGFCGDVNDRTAAATRRAVLPKRVDCRPTNRAVCALKRKRQPGNRNHQASMN